ncbi:hypothetical protein GCM10028803_27400 [Larkinella knui]|uniref:Transporter n=1 Tax=Larkinella knui TaxID=2025310 RepID=A0A3P1CWW4_9BACT|nr:hypothetical protein [Larkinella knui]RRB17783.1 hypothetical protein EHT87_05755 [Larkinella knui]
MKLIYLSVFLGIVLISRAFAQDVYYEPGMTHIPGTYDFILKNGTTFRGQFVRRDSASYLIRTKKEGDRLLSTHEILRADLVGGTLSSGPDFPNGFPFRLFFMPTAYMPEKRSLYFQSSYVLFSRLDVGVTKNWSVGTTFQTLSPQNFHTFSTKFGTKLTSRTHIALHVQYVGVRLNERLLTKLGLAQGIVTVGDAERNITVGAGVTFSGQGVASSGVVTIGYVRKLTPDLTFINQNIILVGEAVEPQYTYLSGLTSAGLRFNRRRHAFDTAILMPIYSSNGLIRTSPLPYLSYQVRIGK